MTVSDKKDKSHSPLLYAVLPMEEQRSTKRTNCWRAKRASPRSFGSDGAAVASATVLHW